MWHKTYHTRPRTLLHLENLEDRTAPAVVAATAGSEPLASTNPILTQEVVSPTVASTGTQTGTTLGTTSLIGTAGAASVTNTFGTALVANALGSGTVPNALGAASIPTGAVAAGQTPAAAVPQTISLPAPSLSSGLGVAASSTFNFASLPGGPVNSTNGGSVGVLGTGAMITNGTAGLPPGGVINVAPDLAALTGNDAVFSIQGLSVRSVFPATQQVAGNAGELPLAMAAGMPATRAMGQDGLMVPRQGGVVPASNSPELPEPDVPLMDFFDSGVGNPGLDVPLVVIGMSSVPTDGAVQPDGTEAGRASKPAPDHSQQMAYAFGPVAVFLAPVGLRRSAPKRSSAEDDDF